MPSFRLAFNIAWSIWWRVALWSYFVAIACSSVLGRLRVYPDGVPPARQLAFVAAFCLAVLPLAIREAMGCRFRDHEVCVVRNGAALSGDLSIVESAQIGILFATMYALFLMARWASPVPPLLLSVFLLNPLLVMLAFRVPYRGFALRIRPLVTIG